MKSEIFKAASDGSVCFNHYTQTKVKMQSTWRPGQAKNFPLYPFEPLNCLRRVDTKICYGTMVPEVSFT
jgi:hypothetical protein